MKKTGCTVQLRSHERFSLFRLCSGLGPLELIRTRACVAPRPLACPLGLARLCAEHNTQMTDTSPPATVRGSRAPTQQLPLLFLQQYFWIEDTHLRHTSPEKISQYGVLSIQTVSTIIYPILYSRLLRGAWLVRGWWLEWCVSHRMTRQNASERA